MTDFREEAEALTHHLLPWQQDYLFSPEKEKMAEGNWRTGKTRIACLAATLISYYIPDNLGFIGRAAGKDLKETTLLTFEEVCPPSLIIKERGYGQTGREYILRTVDPHRPSRIVCDYIVDQQSKRSHIAGMNLGWFLVDQAEEITHADWVKLLGRLSRKQAHKKFALGTANPAGHDWIFQEFFSKGEYQFQGGELYKAVRGPNRLGVVVRSDANRVSNGGFVEDDYFDTLRRTMPPRLQAIMLDGSFDDFSGKICSDFHSTSVHNILPFDIPDHWPWLVSIDPGGTDPWSIGVWRIDQNGYLIRTKEFYQPNVNPNVVWAWLRANVPIEKARYVIDYENRPVMIQLQDELGVVCEPAFKDVYAGCQQMASYFYPIEGVALPSWYEATQPAAQYAKFEKKGCPRIFVFSSECPDFCRELDSYVWDEEGGNKPKKGQSDHTCFVAGTGILTEFGTKCIEDVSVGDLVWTSEGLNPVIAAGKTFDDAEVYEAVFSNGSHITGTGEHPVWTNRGWVPLDSIRYDDIIEVCDEKQLFSKESNTGVTLTQNDGRTESIIDRVQSTFVWGWGTYIKKFGRTQTAPSQRDFTSTIKTTIHSTTTSKIWSACLHKSTETSILQKLLLPFWNICQKFVPWLLNGTVPLSGESGIVPMPRPLCVNGVGLQGNVTAVAATWELGLNPTAFAPTCVNQLGVEQQDSIIKSRSAPCVEKNSFGTATQKQKPALVSVVLRSLRKLKTKHAVYNFTVANCHEYFANGVLVSNCDDTRYAIMSRPIPAQQLPVDRFAHLHTDAASYDSAKHIERLLARARRPKGDNWDSLGIDETEPHASAEFIREWP